jgi:CRP/FNR family nitrogen fixation transcriptional regulator
MFVRNTTDQPREKYLSDFGMTSTSDPLGSLSEFTYRKGAVIFGEKEPAEYVYQVKRGAVRSYKLLSDGRRQIGAFHLQGDIFGFQNGRTHRFTAEAVVNTTVCLIKQRGLEDVADADPVVTRNLIDMTTRSLQHAENHLLVLGRKSSIEKVAAFLLDMDERMNGTATVTLAMSRRDIADYLGLTVETVSRSLSKLHQAGVLRFVGSTHREIALVDRERLAEYDWPGIVT